MKIILNYNFFIAVALALFLHAITFAWLNSQPSINKIKANILSQPTQISVRFNTPIAKKPVEPPKPQPIKQIKKPKPIVKKPTPKKIVKPVKAKVVKPIKTKKQPVKQTITTPQKTVPTVIPVTRNVSLKGSRIAPKYPRRALKLRQQGTTWIRVLIGTNGQQLQTKIYKPSGYSLLDKAALEAVKKWTFNPNIVNGNPIKSWVEVPVEFKIK